MDHRMNVVFVHCLLVLDNYGFWWVFNGDTETHLKFGGNLGRPLT